MKWFLIGFVCLFCSASWVRGITPQDLENQGSDALQRGQYDIAAKAFDAIISGYPNYQDIDDVRIRAGFAYFRAGKYKEAVEHLAKNAADSNKPEFQTEALYFTALAQFGQGQKANDKDAYGQAVATLTTLINLITTAPTATNKGYLETSIYYRALAHYERPDYDDAEKDLRQLIQQFPDSLSRPDYLLLLGTIYAVETNQAVTDKKGADAIRAQADEALKTFDQVSSDPNALVQANDANMSKAEILFLMAQQDPTSIAGFEKALDAYRLVRRKADMIPLQQARLDFLHKVAQAAAGQAISIGAMGNPITLLIQREDGRLDDLKNGPDPIIAALIRMAECYATMKQPDEARTILHRLTLHASLTEDQKKEVDFQILYSYALGGQAEQADQALTDYLNKHAGDPQAQSISYLISAKSLERKDYDMALKQALRSLKDFPQGPYANDAIAMEVQALTGLKRTDESNKILDDFLKNNPTSPQANTMLLARAQNEATDKNFTAAMGDFQKVRDNPSASPDFQAAADVGYIQALQALQKYDDVITEAKSFETKFPTATKVLPSIELFAALAMDQKHDPGAVAALQDIARKYPKEDAAPFALSYVVDIYRRANDVPAMIQATNDLRKAYPESYDALVKAADDVSEILVKSKKFDDAIALYQPLADAPKPEIAAMARDKIGGIWLAAANALGHYQSMPPATRAVAEQDLGNAEQAYLGTLKDFPDQLNAVSDAFDGLVGMAKLRRSWGLLKDADLEGYLGKLATGFTSSEMLARFDLAKAGLVFIYRDGIKQYPAALERFKSIIAANPSLRLTRQETDQYGELLLGARDYATAAKIYGDLLNNAGNDPASQGYAYYGLGAAALGQGDLAQAKEYFLKLKEQTGGGLWHPHILDANYGIALADEKSGQPADIAEAKQIYSQLTLNPRAGTVLQAKALLGAGRLLEKAGNVLTPAAGQAPNEYAVHYYLEPNLISASAVPEQSAEGLFYAGKAYEMAGKSAEAKQQYDTLLQNYATTAPDWAAKAKEAEAKLGQ